MKPGRDVDADAVLQLCLSGEATPALIQVLRSVPDKVAAALDGRALTLDLVLKGLCRYRLGLTPDGQVLLLSDTHPPDAVLTGEPAELVAFLLGDSSLIDAQLRGLLLLALPSAPLTDALARLRRVVAEELRRTTGGLASAFAFGRRFAERLRRWAPLSDFSQAAQQAVAPALLAASACVGSWSSAPAAAANPPHAPLYAPSLTDVAVVRLDASGGSSTTIDSTRPAEGAVVRSDGHGAEKASTPSPAPVRASIEQRSGTVGATVRGEPEPGGRSNTTGLEVRCNNSLVRQLLCERDRSVTPTALGQS